MSKAKTAPMNLGEGDYVWWEGHPYRVTGKPWGGSATAEKVCQHEVTPSITIVDQVTRATAKEIAIHNQRRKRS